jgi:nitroimidazol reductase NimA-like FMN-containing flavoprotein (pyridoxamine 5'-phosphate oxidase superfamily)
VSEKTRLLSAQEVSEAKDVLESAQIVYLSVNDGGPYVVPICFVYDVTEGSESWGRVVFHTGEGRKSRALAVDPRVCLVVVADVAFDQGPEPCADAFIYRSVLVEGSAVLLEERAQREKALRQIVAKYDPRASDLPFTEEDFRMTLVYSVAIETLGYKHRRRRSGS